MYLRKCAFTMLPCVENLEIGPQYFCIDIAFRKAHRKVIFYKVYTCFASMSRNMRILNKVFICKKVEAG